MIFSPAFLSKERIIIEDLYKICIINYSSMDQPLSVSPQYTGSWFLSGCKILQESLVDFVYASSERKGHGLPLCSSCC